MCGPARNLDLPSAERLINMCQLSSRSSLYNHIGDETTFSLLQNTGMSCDDEISVETDN